MLLPKRKQKAKFLPDNSSGSMFSMPTPPSSKKKNRQQRIEVVPFYPHFSHPPPLAQEGSEFTASRRVSQIEQQSPRENYGNTPLLFTAPRPQIAEKKEEKSPLVVIGERRLNVKSARRTSFFHQRALSKDSAQRRPTTMDQEIRLIRREKDSLLALQQTQEPVKRHPSVEERIRTASYKLKKNSLFKLNRTDFTIFGKRGQSITDTEDKKQKGTGRVEKEPTGRRVAKPLSRQKTAEKTHQARLKREPERGGNLRYMSIKELRLHETGILNLYRDEGPKGANHNKEEEATELFDVRLTKDEYESIFEGGGPPSFHEKKAFMENLRKKWREEHGHCSLFERRPIYREARLNYQLPKRMQIKQGDEEGSSDARSWNTTFTSEFLGGSGSGVAKKLISMQRERAQTREGIPARNSGFRRTLKPSLFGDKNFTIAGQIFRLKQRPSPVKVTWKSPYRRYEPHDQASRSRTGLVNSMVVMGRGGLNGSIEVPQASQVHTFLESDVISPVTVSKGLRESQDVPHFPDTEEPSALLREEEQVGGSEEKKTEEDVTQVVLTEQRESVVVLNSVTLKQSEDFERGIESRDGRAKKTTEEKEEPAQQEEEDGSGRKQRIEKRGSDLIAVEQASEISAGSSITHHVYPLLNSSEVRVSRKTEDSGSQTKLTLFPSSRSMKRKFIKLTRAKSKA